MESIANPKKNLPLAQLAPFISVYIMHVPYLTCGILTNAFCRTTITPSYHAESYSPDDNRFDLVCGLNMWQHSTH